MEFAYARPPKHVLSGTWWVLDAKEPLLMEGRRPWKGPVNLETMKIIGCPFEVYMAFKELKHLAGLPVLHKATLERAAARKTERVQIVHSDPTPLRITLGELIRRIK